MPRPLPAIALAAAAFVATPAIACSVAPGYREPTALELAAEADTIVVATIVRGAGPPRVFDRPGLLRPTLLLKGAALPPRLEMADIVLAGTPGVDGTAERSASRELRASHSDSLSGACGRMMFGSGMQLLLFLKRAADGRLSVIRHAFARDAEDVSGRNALWVKAVREYAVIARSPRKSWPARLRTRAAELRALRHPDAAAVAADMAVEIRSLAEQGVR